MADRVLDGTFSRWFDGHTVGDRGKQATTLGSRHKVLGRQFGAIVKLGHVHVQTNRDRALVQVKHLLELHPHDGGSQIGLGFLSRRIFQLEHGERIHVEGVGIAGTRGCSTDVVLAWHFACGSELTLGPVTHELEGGFFLDHHGGGQVPVAARRSRVGVALDLAESFQRLGHGRAGQRLLIKFDERILEKLGPTYTKHHGLKGREILPVLATVCHRDQAGFLDFLRCGKKLIPCLGCSCHAGFLQHGGIGPHPVDTVHVHRRGDILAFVLHHISHDARQQAIPLFGGSNRCQICQYAFRSPFLNRWTFDLGSRRRIARHNTALQNGHGVIATTTRYRKVLPGVALALHDFLQLTHRLGLTARCPPVQHFDLTRDGGISSHYKRHSKSQLGKFQHVIS